MSGQGAESVVALARTVGIHGFTTSAGDGTTPAETGAGSAIDEAAADTIALVHAARLPGYDHDRIAARMAARR